MELMILPQQFALCRLPADAPAPAVPPAAILWSITRTAQELALIVPEQEVQPGWQAVPGWRCIQVQGPLALDMIGVLAALSSTLAEAQVPILAFSTYDTDYVLVRQPDLERARAALEVCGHRFREEE